MTQSNVPGVTLRKILVTGGLGFIGSNLLRMWRLEHPEDELLNVDALTYAASFYNVSGIERIDHVKADLRDKALVAKIVKDFAPDGVIHLAAESHVDQSIHSPSIFFETNLIGTVNLLEACRAQWKMGQAGRFLHVSTDEVFGHLGATGEFSTDSPYAPRSPYSASKAAADHAVRAYHHTFGMDVVVSHCTNNFGPRQHAEKLIPTIINNCIKRLPIPIYGEGTNVRDWIFVEDHCWGIMQAFELGAPGQTYAFSGKTELENKYVAKLICAIMDRMAEDPTYDFLMTTPHEELIEFVADRPGHDFRYAMSSAKVKEEWGWEPEIPFDIALEQTIKWYLDYEIERLKAFGVPLKSV